MQARVVPSAQALQVGDKVEVKSEFVSNNKDSTQKIPVAARGRVLNIDANGDAQIDFGDFSIHWVLKSQWHNLEKEDDALEMINPEDGTDRIACLECGMARRWPRNVAHTTVGEVPEEVIQYVGAATKKTVVAHVSAKMPTREPSVCMPLFGKIELVRSWAKWPYFKHMLVQEFEYDLNNGRVFYDVKAQEEDHHGYMQLITLNSWWKELLSGVKQVGFGMMDIQANVMLIASFFTENAQNDDVVTRKMKYLFTVAWALSFLSCIVTSVMIAKRKWKVASAHTVGDLITQISRIEQLWCFAALVSFAFFNIPISVTDIVITLHPWTNVKKFAAVKCEGARAFMVGYFSEYEYRVSRRYGQQRLVPLQLLSKMVVFCFKVYLCTYDFSLILVVSCLSSIGSMASGWIIVVSLLFDRRILKQTLENKIQEYDEEVRSSARRGGIAQDTPHKRQAKAAAALLDKHYGKAAVAGVNKDLRKPVPTWAPSKGCESPGNDGSEKPCTKCGRKPCHGYVASQEANDTGPKKEAKVKLSEMSRDCHDAMLGPLKGGDIGEVVQVGPFLRGLGYRRLVRSQKEPQRCWWYDDDAITEVPSVPIRRWGRRARAAAEAAVCKVGTN
jgi:hypothetical protein